MSRKKRKQKMNNVIDLYANIKTQTEYDKGQIKKTFTTKDLKQVYPKTESQENVFHAWNNSDHVLLKGSAGTGKTFLAIYLALIEVLDKSTPYDKVIIVRSTLPVRDIGFIKGSTEEKIGVFEDPYRSICDELFQFSKSYNNLKSNGYIEFISTSHLRGITFKDSIIVCDESQNMTDEELSTIITRCGENTRYIICGDTSQSDHSNNRDKTSLDRFHRIISRVKSFSVVNFTIADVVRSGLCKEWLIACEENTD